MQSAMDLITTTFTNTCIDEIIKNQQEMAANISSASPKPKLNHRSTKKRRNKINSQSTPSIF
jgi:hypothetical protein